MPWKKASATTPSAWSVVSQVWSPILLKATSCRKFPHATIYIRLVNISQEEASSRRRRLRPILQDKKQLELTPAPRALEGIALAPALPVTPMKPPDAANPGLTRRGLDAQRLRPLLFLNPPFPCLLPSSSPSSPFLLRFLPPLFLLRSFSCKGLLTRRIQS